MKIALEGGKIVDQILGKAKPITRISGREGIRYGEGIPPFGKKSPYL